MKLSLVVPAYNESGIVEHSIERIDAHLNDLDVSYELVLGDDGSTDDTAARVRDLGLDGIRVIREPHRGKGAILTSALLETRGEYAGFIDADLEIDIGYISEFIDALDDGYDAAVASKNLESEYARRRQPSRRLITGGYNLLTRTLFRSPLSDHQAGLKLFRGDDLRALLPRVSSTGWLWDTEVLVNYLEQGKRIKEIPVEAQRCREGHVNIITTPLVMLWNLLRLYLSRLAPTEFDDAR